MYGVTQAGEIATGSYEDETIVASSASTLVTPSRLSPLAAWFGGTAGTLIIVFGVIGNILLMGAIVAVPGLRKPCNVFIALLALNDFLFLLMNCALGVHVYVQRTWNLGSYLCVYTFFTNAGAVSVSVTNIIFITLYRYLLIVRPNVYRKMSRTSVVTVIVFLTFLFPYCMLGITQLRPENAPPSWEYGRYIWFDPAYMWCVINTGQSEGSWRVVVAYLIILLFVTLLYNRIYKVAKKSRQNINSTTQTAKIKKTERNAQLARTMVVVMAIFVVTYIPWPIVYELEQKRGIPECVGVIVTLLMWSASSVNWLVYGLMNRQFRQAYKHLLWKVHLRRPGAVSPTVSASNNNPKSVTKSTMLTLSVSPNGLQPIATVSST